MRERRRDKREGGGIEERKGGGKGKGAANLNLDSSSIVQHRMLSRIWSMSPSKSRYACFKSVFSSLEPEKQTHLVLLKQGCKGSTINHLGGGVVRIFVNSTECYRVYDTLVLNHFSLL